MKKTLWIALCICVISVFNGCSFGMQAETTPTTQQTSAPTTSVTTAPTQNTTPSTTQGTQSTEISPSTNNGTDETNSSDSGITRSQGRNAIRHR